MDETCFTPRRKERKGRKAKSISSGVLSNSRQKSKPRKPVVALAGFEVTS
jgi:hypothetical protein